MYTSINLINSVINWKEKKVKKCGSFLHLLTHSLLFINNRHVCTHIFLYTCSTWNIKSIKCNNYQIDFCYFLKLEWEEAKLYKPTSQFAVQ